ncbi:MAG: hypothetical protein HY826_13455 [Actinobacteria bacterium]|nr:hypothetical protein [Actinomycetota bacterium]
MTPIAQWLIDADCLLTGDDFELGIDALLQDAECLGQADASQIAGGDARARATRVLRALEARRTTMATELAELVIRRSELARSQNGAKGYLNGTHLVSMH